MKISEVMQVCVEVGENKLLNNISFHLEPGTITALVRAFLFIKQNRFRKKMGVYKTAIQLMVDLTTAIYLLILAGNVVASIFIMGDVIQTYQYYFIFVGKQAIINYWVVAGILGLLRLT